MKENSHLSSIVFRQGVINKKGVLSLVGGGDRVEEANVLSNRTYNKSDFERRLKGFGLYSSCKIILNELLDDFTLEELKEAISKTRSKFKRKEDKEEILETIQWLVHSNYEIKFHPETLLSERVIFPISENEKKGLEDAQFVQFIEGNKNTYYASLYRV